MNTTKLTMMMMNNRILSGPPGPSRPGAAAAVGASASSLSGIPAPYGRACTNCARAKCKCIYRGGGGGTGLGATCERCHRLAKECVPSVTVRKRTPRRPAASRTAQLEEKLDDLVTLLKTHQTGASSAPQRRPSNESSPSSAGVSPHGMGLGTTDVDTYDVSPLLDMPKRTTIPSPPTESASSRISMSGARQGPGSHISSSSAPALSGDLEIGMSGTEELEAEEALAAFRNRFLRFFPYFYAPPSMTASQLRQEKPLFMLAISAVACKNFIKQSALGDKLRNLIAQKTVVEHGSSVDILLAIITYTAWGQLIKRDRPFLALFTRLASSQVMDLGLHRPFSEPSAMLCFKNGKLTPENWSHRRWSTNEEKRACLAAYWLTSMAATVMKRTDPLRWTAYMDEMLQDLARSPEWDGDSVLVTQVKLQQIIEQMTLARWQPGDFTTPGSDLTKGLPVYFVSALREKLREVRAAIPANVRNHDGVEPALYSTELLLSESLLDKTKSPLAARTTANGPLQQLDHLHACVESLARFFDRALAVDPMYYHGVTFGFLSQIAHAMMSLFRLSILDDPLWDRGAVRDRMDLLKIADQLMANFQRVPELTGVGPFPPEPSAASVAAGGQQPDPRTPGNAYLNTFAKSLHMMQSMRVGWEAELKKADAASAPAAGEAGEAMGYEENSAAAGGGSGGPDAEGDVDAEGEREEGNGTGGANGMSGMQEAAPGDGIVSPMGGVMQTPMDGSGMSMMHQQHLPTAQYDPLAGMYFTSDNDGWMADVFQSWDYNTSFNF